MESYKVKDRVRIRDAVGSWHSGTIVNISDYREPSMKYAVALDDYAADYVFVPEYALQKEADE